jgi:lipid-binding SYLF domain-containing protein
MLGLVSVTGCATPAEKRADALAMRDATLAELYTREPGTKETIKAAKGYAVVSAFSVHLGLISLAGGRVVIVDNKKADKPVFDGLFRFAVGPGVAIKTLRGVYIINDDETMQRIADSPWGLGGLIEASFRFGDFGGSLADVASFGDDMNAYYWTKNGFALEAALAFFKLWHNDLNEEPPAN